MTEDKKKQNLVRGVLPFHFTNEISNLEDYFQQHKKWKKESIITGENDLYDYITNLMDLTSKKMQDKAVGNSWKWDDCGSFNKDTYLVKVKEGEEELIWKLKKVGIVLFDTQIGLLWYEIQVEVDAVEVLHRFTNFIKELQRKGKHYRKSSGDKEWKEILLFNDVLQIYLEEIEIDSYFANRHNKEGGIVPDRSIMFEWLLDEGSPKEEEKVLQNAFLLGHCYNQNYSMPKEINKSEFYRPFEDSIWYASLEGCANYVFPEENKVFYSGGYKTRLNTYFYLFLLNLGQYYSLLQLGTEVAELSTDDKKYSPTDTSLEELLDKIHIFNLKYMYSQVSHLTQHNEYNQYLRRRFFINEMHAELESELKILHAMIARKQEEKNAKIAKVFAVISGGFVFAEVTASVNQLVETYYGVPFKEWWLKLVLSLGGPVTIGIVICFVLCVMKVFKKREK